MNPLLDDRVVDFLLFEVLEAERLCTFPHFAEHSRVSFELYLAGVRRMAREVLFPAYRAMDAEPAALRDGRIRVHPRMRAIYPKLVELGVLTATRPAAVGGMQLPLVVSALATAYLMAGNASAYGYLGLTTGAAHLIEAFGDERLRRDVMGPMYRGQWAGTMALSEPQAGSSLADVATRAVPAAGGHYLLRGAKIFISGGDQDLTENVVHLTLARIEGAPAGIRGVSLFAVPARRPEGGALVDNDVRVTGLVHKIGWRGLPSLLLDYGAGGDCRGWLVGEAGRGIAHMFQMMNEARILVGMNAVATASVGYQEALAYARERRQGRPPGARDPAAPQVPIVEHADVRRQLLRQKAIVEGGLALVATTAMMADLAAHAPTEAERRRAGLLLDLLTPVAKSFPAEWGFESNALALQVHGGYGYSSEYLPEALLRDQKLNSIHEGTTGIQGLDLLGRKAVAAGGEAFAALQQEIGDTAARAIRAGVDKDWAGELEFAVASLGEATLHLAQAGLAGDPERMLRHSASYLQAFSIVAVAWQWLRAAAVAREGLAARRGPAELYEGQLCAAQYWIATELPLVAELVALCRSGEDSFARMRPEWF